LRDICSCSRSARRGFFQIVSPQRSAIASSLRSGALAENGFIALAELDVNADGVVNAYDATWSSLLLWVDRDHDGVSDRDELQPIGRSVVTGIATEHRWVGRRDEWGNLFRYRGRFWIRDDRREHERTAYDVFFRLVP
jgi:hypothetical protein